MIRSDHQIVTAFSQLFNAVIYVEKSIGINDNTNLQKFIYIIHQIIN